jgi:DNA topoisomerase-2
MYYLLKRTSNEIINVAQLSGYVAAEMKYHHGPVSLEEAIIKLGRNFTGSNNINLLVPEGNFGSRYLIKDAASSRYTFTKLEEITRVIYNNIDKPILNILEDDGHPVEPEYLVPIIPMVLVNGCEGIGTAYSTSIPSYNPKEIVSNLKKLIKNEPMVEMNPWFRNFKGKIVKVAEHKYTTHGLFTKENETTIKITEIPINSSITGYKEYLETLITKGILKNVDNLTTDENDIVFKVQFASSEYLCNKESNIEKDLKLSSTLTTSNMHLFTENYILKRFNSPLEIIEEYYRIRLCFYEKRRDYIIQTLETDCLFLEAKIRFIKEYTDGIIYLHKRAESDIIDQLVKLKYPKFEGNYDYLLNMTIKSLSLEKINNLQKLLETKNGDLEYTKSKTPSQLWVIDIDKVLERL